MSVMKIDSKTDHGLVVWARMRQGSQPWAALIISVEKMDLLYEETPNKTWVFWLANNHFSQLNNNLISDFFLEFEKNTKTITTTRKDGVLEAIKILSIRFKFDIPEEVRKTKSVIQWMSSKANEFSNSIGKCLRTKEYFIPEQIIKKIKYVHGRHKHAEMQQRKENLEKEENKKIKEICFSSNKKTCQMCIACRGTKIENKYKHPLFQGFICEDCYKKAKLSLFTIAEDLSNVCCSICFTLKADCIVCCDVCVRVFCNTCVSMYCKLSSAFEKLQKQQNWSCFACQNPPRSFPWGLQNLPLEKQIQNMYDFYPAKKTASLTAANQSQKIHVLTLNKHIMKTASEVLTSLQLPFHLENCSGLPPLNDPENGVIKLLLDFYPNDKSYKEQEFTAVPLMKRFFDFIFTKNHLDDNILFGPNPNNFRVFWAFECSASVTTEVLSTITRFCSRDPIVIGMKTEKLRQRARFIWTNISIPEQCVEQVIDSSILTGNMPKNKFRNDKDWCYSSIHTIMNSLSRNI